MKKIGAFLIFLLGIAGCSKDSNDEQKNQIDSLSTLNPKIERITELEETLLEQGLVEVQSQIPSIIVDLKYSTPNNFFGSDVYGDFDKAFLQAEVVASLAEVQSELKEINPDLSLYIFDAVRPLSIQKILWEALDSIPPNVRKAYVADPSEGSIHNFGCAIDLSIFDSKKDSLLDMGTDYDFFGYLAYPRKEDEMLKKGLLSELQIANRQLLRNVMKEGNFMPITSEWWHFNRYSRNEAKQKYGIVE